MFRIYSLLIGYIFGCFQTSYFLGKLNKIDIRNYGSKNAGTTNANRILGKKIAAIVFFTDITKSVLSFIFCSYLFKNNLAGIWSGLGVILGHDFTFFLNFKGGKGIASTIGLVLIFNYKLAAISYLIGIVTLLISRKVSIASLIFVSSLPFIFMKSNYETLCIFIIITILDIWQHRQNIKRIIEKSEPNLF